MNFVTHLQHQFMNQTVMSRQNYIVGAFCFFLFFSKFIVWDSELHDFFYFSIDNVKMLLIIMPNWVHWGYTMGHKSRTKITTIKKNRKRKDRTPLKESVQEQRLRAHLVHVSKHMFSVFKQYYTYFHTLFHSHLFSKKLKTIV